MSFLTGLEALTGHRPGAFTGMTMKDFLDDEMWDRLPRTWSGKKGTPEHLKANPMDIRLKRDTGEPYMTNWARDRTGREMGPPVPQSVPYPSMRANYPAMPAQVQIRALRPRPNVRPTPLQQQRIDTGRDITQRQGLRTQPDIYKDLREAPNPYARPNLLNIFSPLPVMRGDQMGGGYFGRRDKSRMMFGEDKYAYNPLDMPELLGPADKVTKTVTSADPTKFDTSTTTITEKLLGPAGHRMGAFQDTAADMWKNIREDDIIKYWMNQLRGH